MARIDAHGHLIPAAYRAELEQRDLLPPYPLPPATPAVYAETMDRHRIDAAVVSLSPPGVWFGDAGLARELSRLVNEELGGARPRRPSRFAGLATLPLPDVEGALAEIAYALDTLGLDGVALHSNVDGVYLGDPGLRPDLRRARAPRRLRLRPPDPAARPRCRCPGPDLAAGVPFDTTRAVVNLIYSGTLERCPGIRLQLAHMGGAAPFLAHRIAEWAGRDPERPRPPRPAHSPTSAASTTTPASPTTDSRSAASARAGRPRADRLRHRLALRGAPGREIRRPVSASARTSGRWSTAQRRGPGAAAGRRLTGREDYGSRPRRPARRPGATTAHVVRSRPSSCRGRARAKISTAVRA